MLLTSHRHCQLLLHFIKLTSKYLLSDCYNSQFLLRLPYSSVLCYLFQRRLVRKLMNFIYALIHIRNQADNPHQNNLHVSIKSYLQCILELLSLKGCFEIINDSRIQDKPAMLSLLKRCYVTRETFCSSVNSPLSK